MNTSSEEAIAILESPSISFGKKVKHYIKHPKSLKQDKKNVFWGVSFLISVLVLLLIVGITLLVLYIATDTFDSDETEEPSNENETETFNIDIVESPKLNLDAYNRVSNLNDLVQLDPKTSYSFGSSVSLPGTRADPRSELFNDAINNNIRYNPESPYQTCFQQGLEQSGQYNTGWICPEGSGI
jgi:hypothetical protein